MIISQITLKQNAAGHYRCMIKHDGKVVVSGHHKEADAAYRDAESRLIYKPGYVQALPLTETGRRGQIHRIDSPYNGDVTRVTAENG